MAVTFGRFVDPDIAALFEPDENGFADGSRHFSFEVLLAQLIKELRLLARAVFVVDEKGVIRYIQLVKELTQEPDYNAVLEAVKRLTGK